MVANRILNVLFDLMCVIRGRDVLRSTNLLLMRAEFIQALRSNEDAFGLSLDDATIVRLADHFEIVHQNNEFLHLTGPSPVDEFAIRHTLESLMLLDHLPSGARFADVGPGGGFPSIPCLIARADTSAVLIESKEKKAEFLRQAVESLGLTDRVEIIARQFEEVTTKDFSVVTCRALDKFVYKLPQLLKWIKGKQFVFFGGPSLDEALRRSKTKFEKQLLPLSEQRYLFVGG
jgi:16S rRNA (guanine(527)-N(7))-methyltransferase RsmG